MEKSPKISFLPATLSMRITTANSSSNNRGPNTLVKLDSNIQGLSNASKTPSSSSLLGSPALQLQSWPSTPHSLSSTAAAANASGVGGAGGMIPTTFLEKLAKQWRNDKEEYEMRIETLTQRLAQRDSKALTELEVIKVRCKELEEDVAMHACQREVAEKEKTAVQSELANVRDRLHKETHMNDTLQDANVKLEKKVVLLTHQLGQNQTYAEPTGNSGKTGNSTTETTAATMMMEQMVAEQVMVNAQKKIEEKTAEANSLSKQLQEHRQQTNEMRGKLAATQNQLEELLSKLDHKNLQIKKLMTESQNRFKRGSSDEVDPPSGRVVLVFTDVEGSTEQWERDANVMKEAIEKHFVVMREKLKVFGGYEVKTEGDAIMVAFQTPEQAIWWCMAVQEGLLMVDWPPALLSNRSSGEERSEDGHKLLFRGLRIRAGVHCGVAFCCRDPVTYRMDYFGRFVNKAARVSGSAHGGQVVISSELYKLLSPGFLQSSNIDLECLGQITMKGIEGTETLYQILPHSLSLRRFPPPRGCTGSANNNNHTASLSTTPTPTTNEMKGEIENVHVAMAVLNEMMRVEENQGRQEQLESAGGVMKRLWEMCVQMEGMMKEKDEELREMKQKTTQQQQTTPMGQMEEMMRETMKELNQIKMEKATLLKELIESRQSNSTKPTATATLSPTMHTLSPPIVLGTPKQTLLTEPTTPITELKKERAKTATPTMEKKATTTPKQQPPVTTTIMMRSRRRGESATSSCTANSDALKEVRRRQGFAEKSGAKTVSLDCGTLIPSAPSSPQSSSPSPQQTSRAMKPSSTIIPGMSMLLSSPTAAPLRSPQQLASLITLTSPTPTLSF